jgi:hypothetical protein
VHTYANKQLAVQNKLKLDQTQTKLYILGGILPDLVSAMGLDRNYGHQMGKEFYFWCKENADDALAFAYGAWLHGADPVGLDYYADECWHGGNGWCFQKCVPYMDMVERACNIPPKWALWKGHNFVEMAMELVTCELEPTLADELVAARLDNEAVAAADEILHFFAKTEKGVPAKIYRKLPAIFALEGINPVTLAERYKTQLEIRHQIAGSDTGAMAAIIDTVKIKEGREYLPWLNEANTLMQEAINNFQKIWEE